MRRHALLALSLAAALGCGSEGPSAPAGDGGAVDVSADLPSSGRTGRIRVTVTYAGRVMTNAQVQIAASRTMTLVGPGDSFAVVKDPTFPATGELVFAEAGSYWVFVNLNAPPVEAVAGPEDRVGRSMTAVDVQLGATRELTIELLDRDG